jgi:hypothetical protein
MVLARASRPNARVAALKLAAAVAVAAALALALGPSAHANTNRVPNIGFQLDCSGIPCSWVAVGFPLPSVTIATDTTPGLASPPSMKMTMTGTISVGSASSSCVTAAIAAGPHAASFSYLTSDTRVGSVELAGRFFSGANCTGAFSDLGSSTQTTDNGMWNTFSTTITTPAASSVFFVLNMTSFLPMTTPSVNLDNVDFESEVVAARFRWASATRTKQGVLVRWRTASEVDALGFNVYRAVQGKRLRANAHLLPARGASAYSFLDRRAPKATSLRYWIQLVNLDGSRSWYGPAR